MGIVKGLKTIKKQFEEKDAAAAAAQNYVKTEWVKVGPRQAVKFRPLQELDFDSPLYSEAAGVGFLAVEHNNPNPDMYMHKGLCSLNDEGRCWGCEKHKEEAKNGVYGWKQKSRLYLNVLVDDGIKEPYVAILSQPRTTRSIVDDLIDEITDETPSITDRWFEMKNIGETKKESSYRLKPRGNVADDAPAADSYELFDLEKVVRKVPYEEQEAHYLPNQQPEQREPAYAGSAATDAEW